MVLYDGRGSEFDKVLGGRCWSFEQRKALALACIEICVYVQVYVWMNNTPDASSRASRSRLPHISGQCHQGTAAVPVGVRLALTISLCSRPDKSREGGGELSARRCRWRHQIRDGL